MSQATLSGGYHNSNLFSNYYLDERVYDLDAWDCDEEAREVYEELQSLYDAEGDAVGSYKEDPLLKEWIDEVLDALGYQTLSESTLPDGGGYVDRLLFDSAADRRDAANLSSDGMRSAAFKKGIGVLEAKQWGTDFESSFNEDRQYRNASHQIKFYLEATPENIDWGILTDGKKWRLYGTKDYETNTYYEVDLPELLLKDDLEAFKRFYVFFRSEAFREVSGTTFLDEVWSESENAAQELGEDLQDNVFTALRVLGEAFVESNDLDIDPADGEAMEDLKEQSLVLLYRLMFLLYAEGRGLVHPEGPHAQQEYQENFSLEQIRKEIYDDVAETQDFGSEYSEYSTTLWSKLQNLFDLVDTGNDDLGIPPYNGGLFDDDRHGFLAEHEVSDRHLAEVIYRISTTDSEQNGGDVLADYADLDTRHLGSIYEGLLEHRFRIASEDMAAVAEDGAQEWKPATDVSVADAVETVEEGELFVINDDGERKATGAYYTPDYVVTYIVEETIDPLLDDIRADLEADGYERGDSSFVYEFALEVTDLKILDPAMGSGHFLTKATGYLTEQIMAEAREAEVGTLFDEQRIKRRIAKECIYGVDLNEMATELAKLSMWLETLAADQPLAFLDHHLKTGNSLVGSDIEEIEELESDVNGDDDQASLAEFGATRQGTIERLMDIYQEFLSIENEDLDDVKAMERKYREIEQDDLRQRLVAMANVRTAEDFGIDVPSGAFERMARALEDDEEWGAVEATDWYRTAQTLAARQCFFHWRLEFPEAFYQSDGSPMEQYGFDAVIGNPPYVRMEQIKPLKPFLSEKYAVHDSRTDLYAYFVEQSLHLCSGTYSMIISNKWMRAEYGRRLREELSTRTIMEIVDFGDLEVFEGVSTYPCILLVNDREKREVPVSVARLSDLDFNSLRDRIDNVCYMLDREQFGEDVWSIGTAEEQKLKRNLSDGSVELSDYLSRVSDNTISDGIGWGIKTGGNDAFVIDEETREQLVSADPNSSEVIKPFIKGSDISRYLIEFEDRYLLYMKRGIDPERYPAVLDHLEEYRESIGNTATSEEWYELQQAQANYEQYFSSSKICYPDISDECNFSMDDSGVYPANTCYFLPTDSYELLAILNSKTINWYYQYVTSEYRGGYQRSFTHAIKTIPIPADIFEGENHYSSRLAEHAKEISELRESLSRLNLSLSDYLGTYSEGSSLGDLGPMPPSGLADSILTETKKTRDSLRVGGVDIERDEAELTILLSARYKPEDEDDYETDRWGYTETDLEPAMRFTGLDEEQAMLVEAFVPHAVEEAGGFAEFWEKATKAKSLIDRLEELTLPKLDDVADGLQRYREAKERAAELDEKIEQTDELIDEIVYELYGLTDEEIEIVEETVGK